MSDTEERFLWQAVTRWARATPNSEAIVFGDTRMSWKEFAREVDLAAAAFVELGVRPGDRVALLATACPEFLVTYIAASKVGAIWVGLSPKFTLAELLYVVADCQPRVIVSQAAHEGAELTTTAKELANSCAEAAEVLVFGIDPDKVESTNVQSYRGFLDRPRPEAETVLDERLALASSADDVLLIYTSGSTGRPKGVLHSHEHILSSVDVQCRHFKIGNDGRILLHFPINHVAATVEMGFAAIFVGATLVLMDRFDPIASLETVEAEGITMLGQVPVMFLMQMSTPRFRTLDWSRVSAFVWGGSAAPRPMLEGLKALAAGNGAVLMTGYGSTELCGFVTYSAPDDDFERLTHSAGRVVEPFEMKIVDEARDEVSIGVIGEVAFRGPVVMTGYLGNPEASAAVIDEHGWYFTGDMGCCDEDGYLYLSGRRSEMFKTGGENVFPLEIEIVLETHPAVLFAAVLGVPDPLFDEVGRAYVMLKPGVETTADELRIHCRDRLVNFKVPKEFEIRPMLPLLPNGKIDKRSLRALRGES